MLDARALPVIKVTGQREKFDLVTSAVRSLVSQAVAKCYADAQERQQTTTTDGGIFSHDHKRTVAFDPIVFENAVRDILTQLPKQKKIRHADETGSGYVVTTEQSTRPGKFRNVMPTEDDARGMYCTHCSNRGPANVSVSVVRSDAKWIGPIDVRGLCSHCDVLWLHATVVPSAAAAASEIGIDAISQHNLTIEQVKNVNGTTFALLPILVDIGHRAIPSYRWPDRNPAFVLDLPLANDIRADDKFAELLHDKSKRNLLIKKRQRQHSLLFALRTIKKCLTGPKKVQYGNPAYSASSVDIQ